MIGSNKRKLKQLLNEISQKLKDDYDLKLKYDTPDQIFDIGKRPIDFVGFKFTYGSTTVRNAIFRRQIKPYIQLKIFLVFFLIMGGLEQEML